MARHVISICWWRVRCRQLMQIATNTLATPTFAMFLWTGWYQKPGPPSGPRRSRRASSLDAHEEPPSCTTHFSIADETGNAVSCTHTLGTGSGVITPGLGFVYNNSMKLFDLCPGSRFHRSGQGPNYGNGTDHALREGKPAIVVGAPGGSVIISAVLQTIINIVDFGMSPVEAVTVPRIHCEGAALHAEARVQSSVCRELVAMGHHVIQSAISFDPLMSRAHVVENR